MHAIKEKEFDPPPIVMLLTNLSSNRIQNSFQNLLWRKLYVGTSPLITKITFSLTR